MKTIPENSRKIQGKFNEKDDNSFMFFVLLLDTATKSSCLQRAKNT